MSDAMMPSYRVPREASAVPWRMLAVAGGLVGVLAVGAGGWWAWRSWSSAAVPVVEAPSGPHKVRPADAGGLRVPNQTELILERPAQRTQTPAQAGRPASVAPEAESPNLGGLRAAVQPPAPPAAPAPQAAAPQPAAPLPTAPQPAAPPAPAPATAARPAAPPSPQATTPAAPPARPATGRVQVQLGALASEEAARAEWERLQRRAPELLSGRSPQISRLDRGEGQPPLFRLRTGGLPDAEAAAQLCEQLRARGGACVPVRG